MSRSPRFLQRNVVYHVYNRRNEKRCLFETDDAYERFIRLIKQGKEDYAVRIHAYCLMRTHWHLALSADVASSISAFMQWLTGTHATKFRHSTFTVGLGHVYQGRYCSVAVDGVLHYVRLVRYIEANPVEAQLVPRAQDWPWSSLRTRLAGNTFLDDGPWRLPDPWIDIVNTCEPSIEQLPGLMGQIPSFRPDPISFH